MNKIILLFVLTFSFTAIGISQEVQLAKTSNYFTEINFGAALVIDRKFVLPGASFLWGKTITYANNTVVEYEAGFALPTLVTGKVGIGKKIKNIKLIAGVRPFPSNLYIQTSFKQRQKGYWVVSLEYNPINEDSGISFLSKALFTVGYRWDRQKK